MDALHPLLQKAYDPDRFGRLARDVVSDMERHLREAQSRQTERSMPWTPPEEERAFWEGRLDRPEGLVELMRLVVDRSNRLQDPRYMGHQVAVPFPDGALVG
ncbi:MAG: hypothetical protein ACPG85_00085, partial [Flavobacteriales bacterium]